MIDNFFGELNCKNKCKLLNSFRDGHRFPVQLRSRTHRWLATSQGTPTHPPPPGYFYFKRVIEERTMLTQTNEFLMAEF